ncbi:ATP-binding protein [Microbispora bryophytorum]|nr:tetratricopeptide repeat protein [Microbispora bryophytorum]MBD3140737.1 tetratricopeptide repeat protein [Microbispora bryophytorum]TQS00766.1 tetratricopeptide repeat protein [Microbispora bryophytorum]
MTSTQRFRHVIPFIAALVTAIAVFAGIVAGVNDGDGLGQEQFIFAIVASMLSGGIAFWQVKDQVGKQRQELPAANGTHLPQAGRLYQLPPDIEDFTGRAEDATELARLLISRRADTAVVVTALSGKGGVGKTTLALHVAHRIRNQFPDGQLYVNLRGAEAQVLDPAEVLSRFLRELGIDSASIPEHLEDRARMYRAQLADRRIFLLLDNALNEQQIRPLLPGSPSCAVLITSRSRLAALSGAHIHSLDVMTVEQALDLLRHIVGRARVAAEPEAASEIVRLCGRLPLALRIAGARLASRQTDRLAGFAARLRDEQHRLDLLKVGDLEVRANFALSYQGCDEELRRAFRLLGVLKAADFSAWTLAALAGVSLQAAEEMLERLVDAELIEIGGEDQTGIRRYRFHDLLRVYARERLAEEESEADREKALARLLELYIALATNVSVLLEPGGYGEPAHVDPALLRAIHRDPREYFLTHETTFLLGVELAGETELWRHAWRLTRALPVTSLWPSDWSTWVRVHLIGLDAAQRDGSREGEAEIRCQMGAIHRAQGDYTFAEQHLRASAEIAEEIGDELRGAIALSVLGDTYRYTGSLDQGVRCFTQALNVFRRRDIPRYIAWALNGLGDLQRGQSKWQEAIDSFTECIQIFDQLGDRLESARARVRFGIVYRDQCLYGEAERLYLNGLGVIRESGDRRWEARTLRQLGVLWRNMGRTKQAIKALNEAQEIFEELVDRRGVAVVLRNKGDAYRRAGDYKAALECLEDALARFQELEDRRWQARSRMSIADTIRHAARWEEADAHLKAASEILQEIDDCPGQARVLRTFGLFHTGQRHWKQAIEAYQESRTIYESLGDRAWAGRTMAEEAAVHQAMGDEETWRDLRRRAEQICRDCGARTDDEVGLWLTSW